MGLGTIMKLKAMLTDKNLQYLSIILEIILREDAIGKLVWDAFGKRFKDPLNAVATARPRLYEIKRMVDEYRSS